MTQAKRSSQEGGGGGRRDKAFIRKVYSSSFLAARRGTDSRPWVGDRFTEPFMMLVIRGLHPDVEYLLMKCPSLGL